MEKKEYYKHNLPHFQQPGQAYFVTWNLKDAAPKKALLRYSKKLEILKSQIEIDRINSVGVADSDPRFITSESKSTAPGKKYPEFASSIENLRKEYTALRKQYLKAYNDLLDAEKNPKINLSKSGNLKVLMETLKYWEEKKLKSHAFCIMPNHVHWVFELLKIDEFGESVYLQDIMYSVKRFSASEINKLENRKGELWQKESFDTTIRDEKHLYYAIEYTLNNPVKAGLVEDRMQWTGSWVRE